MTVNPRPLPRGPFHREGINNTLGMAIGAIAIALIVGVGIHILKPRPVRVSSKKKGV